MANYAELKLYFGLVNSWGLREGRYEHDPSSDGSRRAVANARDEIERFLHTDMGRRLTIGLAEVARTEPESLQLITHAESNLPSAKGLVVPFDVIHGSLRFHRVIRFGGVGRESLEEVVAVTKQSGHLPYTKDDARREFIIKEEEFLRMNDQKWRAAIKFY